MSLEKRVFWKKKSKTIMFLLQYWKASSDSYIFVLKVYKIGLVEHCTQDLRQSVNCSEGKTRKKKKRRNMPESDILELKADILGLSQWRGDLKKKKLIYNKIKKKQKKQNKVKLD